MKNPAWYRIARSGNRATVSIFGEIISDNEQLAEFERELEGVLTVELLIDSIGGSAGAGVKVNDILAGRCTVATITGRAYSSAIPIAMAADKIHCYPDTRLMIHAPNCFAYGSADQLRLEADGLQSTENSFVRIISERTKLPVETVRGWMTGDHYFEPDAAHALGLVDEIIERPMSPPVETITGADDEPAAAQTESEKLFHEFLRAFGPVKVANKDQFMRDLSAWLACEVTESICG